MTNQTRLWLNMASREEPGEKKISQIFDEGMKIFEDVSKTSEATNSSTVQVSTTRYMSRILLKTFQILVYTQNTCYKRRLYIYCNIVYFCFQVKVKKAMRLFEEATELVSMAGIFSSNESIEEVATNNIRYFLLPALLGTLSLKLCVEDRFNVVETAEIYFRDFLRRCKSYAIVDVGIPEPKENSSESTESVQQSHAADLAAMSRQRNSKLQRYREQKQLESELEDIKRSLCSMSIVDEEVERKYYLTLIKNFAIQAVDELHSIEMEKPLLEYMAKVRKDEHFTSAGDKVKKGKFPPPKPLQPFIITKNEVQKKVFGAGYPSLPVMTVQEFYEKRVKDGE